MTQPKEIPMTELHKGGGLSANQIAWCRKNINAFDFAWRNVKAADEHAAKVRRELEKAA